MANFKFELNGNSMDEVKELLSIRTQKEKEVVEVVKEVCPMCGSADYQKNENVLMPYYGHNGELPIKHEDRICNNCGYWYAVFVGDLNENK